MDQWGLAWPLQANAGKLRLCHELGKSVHALGVGVDRLQDPAGLRIFQQAYLPIASWSVRSKSCKEALLELGVTDEKIVVGADWAWLLSPQIDSEWANESLQKAGASTGRLHIGVNLVNEIWKDQVEMKKTWGSLLDRLIEKYDAEMFFFCNESREGDYFDQAAAAEVREGMRHPSVMVTNRYYEPEQMISLLFCMQLSLSQRYHFTLFSILADVYPISIQRGQKMEGLNQELDLPFVGDMTHLDKESIEKGNRGSIERFRGQTAAPQSAPETSGSTCHEQPLPGKILNGPIFRSCRVRSQSGLKRSGVRSNNGHHIFC